MNIERFNESSARFRGVDFDARLTLIDSAQVFHWREEGGAFCGATAGRHARLVPCEDGFLLEGCAAGDEPFWIHYFDLERDYSRLAERVRDYEMAYRAMKRLPGLRVLNQPAWEALIAFIISANNNVSRIRGIVARLIAALGVEGAFPTPERLAETDEETLRALGCGYRAPYLIDTAARVRDGFDLQAVSALPYEEAHKRLLTLSGVGDKVADCVQLFGMGQSMAFPVDVWVERLMKTWFVPETAGKAEIRRAAHAMFGDDAGLIQQSLFHCARLGLLKLEK